MKLTDSTPRGVAALVFGYGKVLALQCVKGRGLILPGGSCNEGENEYFACIRELAEETNMDAANIRLVYESIDVSGFFCSTFLAVVKPTEHVHMRNMGSGQPMWVSKQCLLDPTQSYFHQYYKELFDQQITLYIGELSLGF